MKDGIDIKKEIITVMEQVSSEEVLRAVYTLLEREARHENNLLSPFYEPSEAERSAIDEGLKDIVEGRIHSHSEVMTKFKTTYGI